MEIAQHNGRKKGHSHQVEQTQHEWQIQEPALRRFRHLFINSIPIAEFFDCLSNGALNEILQNSGSDKYYGENQQEQFPSAFHQKNLLNFVEES